MKIIVFVLLMLMIGSVGIQTISAQNFFLLNTKIYICNSTSNDTTNLYTNQDGFPFKIDAGLMRMDLGAPPLLYYPHVKYLNFEILNPMGKKIWEAKIEISNVTGLASPIIENKELETWPSGNYHLFIRYIGNYDEKLTPAFRRAMIHHNMTIIE